MNIGLHTVDPFTGNVGDALITDSILSILQDVTGDSNFEFDQTYYRGEDLTSRLDTINEADAIFLTKARITDRDMRPKKYPIAESLHDVDPALIPLSGAYWFYPGTEEFIRHQTLHSSTKRFLDVLVSNTPDNQFPVRSAWVGRVLERNGYNARLVGDPAWYHPEYIGKSFHRPDSINQLVLTPPHGEFYREQCETLLSELADRYPDARRIISYQSVLDGTDRRLREVAKQQGWEIQYASHDTSNLEIYHESDLHIGYRKHGHLAHLRLRKPSIVIAEDSRAMGIGTPINKVSIPGFETRFGTSVTRLLNPLANSKPAQAIDIVADNLPLDKPWSELKFDVVTKPNPHTVPTALRIAEEQMDQGWPVYDEIAGYINKTYQDSMYPFVSEIIDSL